MTSFTKSRLRQREQAQALKKIYLKKKDFHTGKLKTLTSNDLEIMDTNLTISHNRIFFFFKENK